ncbi:MAG: hypothetical protein WCK70_12530 [Chloroflexales bacterium]
MSIVTPLIIVGTALLFVATVIDSHSKHAMGIAIAGSCCCVGGYLITIFGVSAP